MFWVIVVVLDNRHQMVPKHSLLTDAVWENGVSQTVLERRERKQVVTSSVDGDGSENVLALHTPGPSD